LTFTEPAVTSAAPGAEVGHAGAAGQVGLVTFLAEVTEQRSTEGRLVIAAVHIDVVLENKEGNINAEKIIIESCNGIKTFSLSSTCYYFTEPAQDRCIHFTISVNHT
jgi:hypothetical protein